MTVLEDKQDRQTNRRQTGIILTDGRSNKTGRDGEDKQEEYRQE